MEGAIPKSQSGSKKELFREKKFHLSCEEFDLGFGGKLIIGFFDLDTLANDYHQRQKCKIIFF